MSKLLTIDAKVIAAAFTCQAFQDVRYYLNGIYFEPIEDGGVRAVATDGHRMIVVTDKNGECEAPIIIDFEKTAVTKMKAKGAGVVAVSRVDEDTVIAKIHGNTDHVSSVNIVSGTFPDYRAVIKSELPKESAGFVPFNSEYMRGFCDVAKILDMPNNAISFVNGAAN